MVRNVNRISYYIYIPISCTFRLKWILSILQFQSSVILSFEQSDQYVIVILVIVDNVDYVLNTELNVVVVTDRLLLLHTPLFSVFGLTFDTGRQALILLVITVWTCEQASRAWEILPWIRGEYFLGLIRIALPHRLHYTHGY